jgi:hypothetical protein
MCSPENLHCQPKQADRGAADDGSRNIDGQWLLENGHDLSPPSRKALHGLTALRPLVALS